MTARWQYYHVPGTVEEAVTLLADYDGQAQLVGGGTDLLLDIGQGRANAPKALVDPTRIADLGGISHDDGFIVIGCGATHTMITNHRDIIEHGTCLAESCGVIGGPQVRNVATLAGNIAHAMPAGDGTVGLLTLAGEVETADQDGRRWMPLAGAFRGPGRSTIDHHRSLLTRMRFRPAGERAGSAFFRVMRPQGVALPMIAMAASVQLAPDDVIASANICIAPAGPVPRLADGATTVIAGRPASPDLFLAAADAALDELSLRDSKYRATRVYREEMIRTHLPRVLATAVDRAATGHVVPWRGAA